MLEMAIKGGPVMIPIALCSIIALAIFLERIWSLRRSNVIPKDFLMEIEDLIRREKIPEAMILCKRNNTPIARIILAGIKNYGRRREIIKEIIEETGKQEASELSRYISIVGTMAGVSPLLGLLGTVTGMIKAFNVISIAGTGNPSLLAEGISEALITTAAGLMVAIPAFLMHRFLVSHSDSLITEMEEFSIRIIDLLKSDED